MITCIPFFPWYVQKNVPAVAGMVSTWVKQPNQNVSRTKLNSYHPSEGTDSSCLANIFIKTCRNFFIWGTSTPWSNLDTIFCEKGPRHKTSRLFYSG